MTRVRITALSRLILWLGYWMLLCISTHLPPGTVTLPGSRFDKAAHVMCFALLGLLGAWVVDRRLIWRVGLLVALLGYAAADEYSQAWVGRTPEVADWLADGLGILLGVASAFVIFRQRAPRSQTAHSLGKSM